MPLNFDWTGRNELERIAEIRWRCYGSRGGERDEFRRRAASGRMEPGDVCIASYEGEDVGTATSLSMHMHIRGKRIPCQGIAWVGTAKSHRRRSGDEKGVASQIMSGLIDKARQRKQSVSALMPFRASFYEHFGFGLVEYQNVWTIPLGLLPQAGAEGWRFGNETDMPAMLACRSRQATAGHCDVETDAAGLREWFDSLADDTQLFTQYQGERIGAYTWVKTVDESEQLIAQLIQPSWDSPAALLSLLAMIGSLKDQYSAVRIVLPTDLPLNWMLKEHQIPHRTVQHTAATCCMISRMQARIIDPVDFLSGQQLARGMDESVIIRMHESEGTSLIFELAAPAGLIECRPSTKKPDIEMTDVIFTAIACGSLRASAALECGLIPASPSTGHKMILLDALDDGPAAFSYEYF